MAGYPQRPGAYRPSRRKNRGPIILMGCASIIVICIGFSVIGFLLFRDKIAGIALGIMNVQPSGETAALFENVTPAPTVVIVNPSPAPENVIIDLGTFGGSQSVTVAEAQATVVVGSDASGASLATVTFTEQALMDLCRQRSPICSEGNSQYRNTRIDLRPGGAIIYADVFIPQLNIWQPAGLILRLDQSQRQFVVDGIDLGGMRYSTLPSGFESVSTLMNDFEQQGNDLLNQLAIEAGQGRYTLSQAQISEDTLTLVMAA